MLVYIAASYLSMLAIYSRAFDRACSLDSPYRHETPAVTTNVVLLLSANVPDPDMLILLLGGIDPTTRTLVDALQT